MMNQYSTNSRLKSDGTSFYASTKSNNQPKQMKQLEMMQNYKNEEMFVGNGFQSDHPSDLKNISKQMNQKNKKINIVQNYAARAINKIIKDIQYGLIDVSQKKIDLVDHSKTKQKNEIEKQKYIDLEQHKKLIRKFTNDRKKKQKLLQSRSIQIQKKHKQIQEQEKKIREEKQQKELSQRKIKIQERLNQLNELKLQRTQKLKLSIIESENIKKKKLLEEIYEEKFKQKILKPIQEQQKKILQEIKNQRKPIDFKQIKNHEVKYIKKKQQQSHSQKKINDNNWNYEPPLYIPKSYLTLEQEQKQKLQQKFEKERIKEQNNRKKQKFIEFLNQNFREKIKSTQMKNEKQKQQQKKNITTLQILPNEKLKQRGNEYLQFNKKKSKKKTISQAIIANNQTSLQNIKMDQQLKQQDIKKVNPLQLLSLKKQMRIKNQNDIRSNHLKSILENKNKSNVQKLQLLKLQSQKLDQLAERKFQILKYKKQQHQQHDEAVEILVNSIKAKIGILKFKNQVS